MSYAKLSFLVPMVLVSAAASAATVDLRSGESRYFGGDLVRCEVQAVDPTPVPPRRSVVARFCRCGGEYGREIQLVINFDDGTSEVNDIRDVFSWTRAGHNADDCVAALPTEPACRNL